MTIQEQQDMTLNRLVNAALEWFDADFYGDQKKRDARRNLIKAVLAYREARPHS